MLRVYFRPNSFRMMLRKSLESARGPRRDEFHVLATAIWVEKVRIALNLPTPYAVQRYINPEAFHRNTSGDIYHDNKWSRYAVGQHRPIDALVERVERIVPGTARLLRHPLWEVLRIPSMSVWQKDRWLRGLNGDIQQVLFAGGSSKKVRRTGEIPVATIVQLDMLKRRAGLDALAALTYLMREAHTQGQSELALRIGDYLYEVLLITCMFSPFRFLTRELFDCFQRRVFADVQYAGQKIDLGAFNCEIFVELLALAVRQARNACHFGYEQADIVPVCFRLQSPSHPDVLFGLASPRVLGDRDVTPETKAWLESRDSYRVWGIERILALRAEKFPPDEVRRGSRRIVQLRELISDPKLRDFDLGHLCAAISASRG